MKREHSSLGEELAWHAQSRKFSSSILHHNWFTPVIPALESIYIASGRSAWATWSLCLR